MSMNMQAISTMMSTLQASGRPEGVGRPKGVGRPEGAGPPKEIQQMREQTREVSSSSDSNLNVSPMGQLISNISNLSGAERSEMQQFLGQMAESIKSGEFDAAVMAEQAPDAMKAFADGNGVDHTALLEQISDRIKQRSTQVGGAMHYQAMGMISDFEQGDDELSALLEALAGDSESDEPDV